MSGHSSYTTFKKPRIDWTGQVEYPVLNLASQFAAVGYNRQRTGMFGVSSLSRAKRRWGRKRRQNLRQAWKVLRVNTQKNILRWQGVSQYDTQTGGKFQLRLRGIGANNRDAPLHIYNLTGGINYDSSSGVISAESPARYMLYSTGGDLFTGSVSFGVLPGQKLMDPGSGYNQWQYEKTENGAAQVITQPNQADQLDWVHVKMLLYGTQTQAVKYRIDFVQLQDPWLDPDSLVNDAEKVSDRNRFWFNMIKAYTYNPILTPQTRDLKALKVLRTYRCTIDPVTTIEQPADGTVVVPHTKELSMFYRMNRTQRYDWVDNNVGTPALGQNVTLENAGVEQIANPVNKSDVHPRARVYMIVRALSTHQGQTADYDIKFNPSYDIVIRKSHSQLSA